MSPMAARGACVVEQPDDVRIQLVNRLAMFGNVQAKVECRIYMKNQTCFGPLPRTAKWNQSPTRTRV